MHHDPAGKRFVGIEGGFPGLTEVVGDLGVVALCTESIGPAVFAFESLFGAGEIFRCEECGRESVLSSASGMKTLGHGSEHLPQADRLHGCETDGPEHLLLGEAEEASGSGSSPEYSRGAGDVPPGIIVGGVDCVSDAALRFDADNQSVQKIAA